ncbi:MAG: LacI family DNA-binding transcriptional regulator [Bacteroidales bacterium]
MIEKRQQVTIYDLAKELNTTPSTVSRALQNHPRISEKMKKAVKELAEKWNYHTDPVAQHLRTGKSHVIAVVVPRIDRKFFAAAIGGIENIASAKGYDVIISQSNENYEKEKIVMKTIEKKKVDAVAVSLAAQTTDYSHFLPFIQKDIPIVFFDRIPEELEVSKVETDNYKGAYQAVTHLIEQGCTKIGHLAGPMTLSVYRHRLEGYKQALKDHGLPFKDEWVIPDTITYETGEIAAGKILDLSDRPDGVYSAGDFSAMGFMLKLKKNGIAIPDDIAVVGFANESFDDFSEPGLTSVDLFSSELGAKAAEIIFEQMEQKRENRVHKHIKLEPQLVIRSSSLKKKL